MEDVSCWSSLSELQPSSFNCSAASIDFRCIPAQSRHIFVLKWDKYKLAVTSHRHYGVDACQTKQVWRSVKRSLYAWNPTSYYEHETGYRPSDARGTIWLLIFCAA
jgi:hypothetical protein